MSAQAIGAATRDLDAQLALARAQGLAGIRAGIALAAEGKPLPEDVTTEDSWWGHCLISGYDAAKD